MVDVDSAVKSAVMAIQAKGMRTCKSTDAANAYAVGYLQSTLMRMIDMLPKSQQKAMVAELNAVAAHCVRN